MNLKGKAGFGGEVEAQLVVLHGGTWQAENDLAGKIVILLSTPSREFLEKASLVGVKGVVAPGIHYRDFLYFKELDEFSLLILTQFGKLEINEELAKKLEKLSGGEGTLNGEEKTLTLDK